jgi:mono/diheme cytochrome c family protein
MKKNKYLLLISSAAVLVLLVGAAAEDTYFKQWRRIQQTGIGEEGPIPVQLRQVVNNNLRIADRCVSCHVSMGPGESSVRGAAILMPHKPVVHDPAEYGCTVCHGGQGQATERDDAHGAVHFWPEPMLDKDMSYAGCGACHAALGVPSYSQLQKATLSFERLDCYACHRVDGKGGTIRPDLGGMEGPDLSRAGITGFAADWYTKHLANAQSSVSGPWKTAFRPVNEADLALLAIYLRTRVGAPKLIEAKGAFHSGGCLGCHKVSGTGGDEGPDLTIAGFKDPGQVSFAQVTGQGTMRDWLVEHFKSPASVVVGSQMPPAALSDKETGLLTLYTLSLRRRELPDIYLPKDRIRATKFGEREFAGDGETIYGTFCSGCHGLDGQGRRLPGLASFPSIANRDFLSIATDDMITKTIEQGRPGRRMPGWLHEGGLTRGEIQAVVAYIRALGVTPAAADPRPTRWASGDKAQGRQLFASFCSGCHGPDGKGAEGPALNNKVLLDSATDTYLMTTIGKGRNGTAMAGFLDATPIRPALSQSDMESIVTYLRSLNGGKQ